ncbi:ras family-domain-containing protein [Filobasidium floriforme]|nr:ras family-domain-containing protein [Filobasidium floriforme]KAH8082562.1 ras family-domain-containing protein [Filobasidium floriforme]
MSESTSKVALKRKILVMGSRSVGKSSLTSLYMQNQFNDSYYPTIESTYHKDIVHDGITYECEIIDTAGQDEYSLFNHKYAVGIHGYILVYSIASRQSFEMIQTLHDKILDFQGVEKVCCVVVGQKSDLGGVRQVKTDEGRSVAQKLGASFIETSAKDNKNVQQVFDLLMVEMRKVFNPPQEKKNASGKSSAGGAASSSASGGSTGGGWFSGWFGSKK